MEELSRITARINDTSPSIIFDGWFAAWCQFYGFSLTRCTDVRAHDPSAGKYVECPQRVHVKP